MHSEWMVVYLPCVMPVISLATYTDRGTDVVGALTMESGRIALDAPLMDGGSSIMLDRYLFGWRLIRSRRWCGHCAWSSQEYHEFCSWCHSRGWWYAY